MALETLNGITEIGGVKIVHLPKSIPREEYLELIKESFIIHGEDNNTITFKIQNGPIGEVGVNGCQVTDMLAVIQRIYQELDNKFHCHENEMTVLSCGQGLAWQNARTKNREARGVEGKSAQ